MKLILITSPSFFLEEDNIINLLFEEGLEILHLRKPNSEPIYCERLLKLISEQWRKKIVVHDHFYLKSEYGLMGIHLNSRHPEIPEGYKGHVSRSCHSLNEVKEWSPKCNYVFLSPIFDSISKKGYLSGFDDDTLKQASKNGTINKHVMALGGVTLENIPKIKDMGFGGAVVMGDLWKRFDSHSSANYMDLVKYFSKLRKAAD